MRGTPGSRPPSGPGCSSPGASGKTGSGSRTRRPGDRDGGQPPAARPSPDRLPRLDRRLRPRPVRAVRRPGQPPADALAHPVPTTGVTPPGEPLTVPWNRPTPPAPRRPASPEPRPEEAPVEACLSRSRSPPGRPPEVGNDRVGRSTHGPRVGRMQMCDNRGVRIPGRGWRKFAASVVYPTMLLAVMISGCSSPHNLRWPRFPKDPRGPQPAQSWQDQANASQPAARRPCLPAGRSRRRSPPVRRRKGTEALCGLRPNPPRAHRREPADRGPARRTGIPDRPDDRAAAGRGREPVDRRSTAADWWRRWPPSKGPGPCSFPR